MAIFPVMFDVIKNKRVLITGGTSGLGRSLAVEFLGLGFNVFALGRNDISNEIKNQNFNFIQCEFSDLQSVKTIGEQLAKEKGGFSFIINSAGILSPPGYEQTKNGFELSYQVNFLSHVLLTSLIHGGNYSKPECIVNISSPLYVKGRIDQGQLINRENYRIVQAYAQTKLFMALFSEKLYLDGNPGFCFDPGTFSSGIYRSQQKWFHYMYKIAAPFMVSSDRVAKGLLRIIDTKSWPDGEMINRKGLTRNLKYYDPELKNAFWHGVGMQIEDFLK
ncbi:MAG: SDR family NAD(P)-dependent oxidoreductase [Cyclobacteriaceae bacterium]|nr:SDR family NAD(P)-dependent oxidoreductase [Cyclobacteriaceae bacterium]